jgi:hypothetical protein
MLCKYVTAAALFSVCFAAQTKAQSLFFQPPTYPGSGQVVTADFNGGGKLDLVSADGTVQLGNGDGTFKTGTPWSVTAQKNGVLCTG